MGNAIKHPGDSWSVVGQRFADLFITGFFFISSPVNLFRISSQFVSLSLLMLPLAAPTAALAHGSHGGTETELEAGEFDFSPIISIEGHGGFDTNLDGDPRHYAIDGMFGGVFSWGLGQGATLSVEAAVGPALVWGEAEHFYGKVHLDDHDSHGHDSHDHDSDGDDEHGNEDHDSHDAHDHDHDHHDHHDHDDHDHSLHKEDHDVHGEDDHNDHGHGEHAHAHDTDYKRTDFKGLLKVRYAPTDRFDIALSWNPYYVTKNQGDDIEGLKNELGAKVTWALGDGDVNFGLGDGIEDLVDGVYLSVDHRQGWESDGMYVGNYTDPRVGLGFKFGGDEISFNIEAGPRFYVPGGYAGLDQRTDLAGEIGLSVPVGDANLFMHWQHVYSWENAPGWGEGWQHHVGTGVSFSF